ncbi:unnamed protein product [Periconia digitata]|uniref:Uncharacterized protein n=1 Tax=Periconia digitata TaxID=1303443 RepID=A0A9W4U7J5_9PLEO|nr:unnamed protein product [Periconia digitata]
MVYVIVSIGLSWEHPDSFIYHHRLPISSHPVVICSIHPSTLPAFRLLHLRRSPRLGWRRPDSHAPNRHSNPPFPNDIPPSFVTVPHEPWIADHHEETITILSTSALPACVIPIISLAQYRQAALALAMARQLIATSCQGSPTPSSLPPSPSP